MHNRAWGTTFQDNVDPIEMVLFGRAVDKFACNLVSLPVTDEKTGQMITPIPEWFTFEVLLS